MVISGAAPVQILDVTGPLEVFSHAPGYEVILAASNRHNELETHRAVRLAGAVPQSSISGPIDTLVIAGGPGAESGQYDPAYLEFVTSAAARSRRVASVCSGVFTLAAAGLLNGKKVVTHWHFYDRLVNEFPKVKVKRDPIFLKDGNIYTSAGITAGIDLCLALVEEDHGHELALFIARVLVMFLVRPGGQVQYSHMLSRQSTCSEPLRELQVYMLENLGSDLSVEALAERVRMSPRNFSRVCLREMKMSPGQFVDRLRVEAAQQMIDSSSKGLKQIADECGFGTADSMRRAFQRVMQITASEYAQRFKRSEAGYL